ncbi:hypothetical protein FACS1894142_4240 [Spirochaetia bacterium]|nr:hypothetical protein FACS1894142_4240 [Spirochaetia bacterium]
MAECLLRDGSPTFARMKGILPSIEKGRYLFLSGIASWHGLVVMPNGETFPQETAECPTPLPLFSPLEEDPDADRAETRQELLDGWIPVVKTQYTFSDKTMEIWCFVEFGDPDRDPQLWVSVLHSGRERRCFVISQSRPLRKREIYGQEFDEALCTTADEWRCLAQGGSGSHGFDVFELPHREIKTAILAMVSNLFATFTADHAHYGHRYYGRNIHDNFPPSYLAGIELCYTLGMKKQAYGMLTHLLRFGIDIKGRFYYRQGLKDWYGASGTEYGRLFRLINVMHTSAPLDYPMQPFLDTLVHMGDYIIGQLHADKDGRVLLMMCAEADTRSRIHAYTSNNLWCVAGLRTLGKLLEQFSRPEGTRFSSCAERLYKDIRTMLDQETVQTSFGPLVPFQSGYTPTPLTLSFCKDISGAPPPDSYFEQLDFDSRIHTEQDYSENTYANYRYYAEMLSSGLLHPDEADALAAMREALGGELLGMSRLYERLDDWPADNYARYLLETDRLEKYLVLYYAHLLYHGNMETGVYYEQVTADGKVFAPDCVPSLTLIPLMTAWMFCFQPVNGDEVYLLRGLPADWLTGTTPLAAHHLACTSGEVSLFVIPSAHETAIKIDTDKPWQDRIVYIDLHSEPSPEIDMIHVQGAHIESTSHPGRFRLYMQGIHAEITFPLHACKRL